MYGGFRGWTKAVTISSQWLTWRRLHAWVMISFFACCGVVNFTEGENSAPCDRSIDQEKRELVMVVDFSGNTRGDSFLISAVQIVILVGLSRMWEGGVGCQGGGYFLRWQWWIGCVI